MKPLEKSQKKQSKEQEYLEGWKRARADLENMQKRMEADKHQHRTFIKRDIAELLIPLADNFRSLTSHAPDTTQDPWAAGVVHVARQFEQTLQEFGVEIIADTGGQFNPSIHEAVEEVKGKEEPGTVVELVLAGYKIGETVIRPAKVKIIETPPDAPHPNPLPERERGTTNNNY